MKAKTDVTILNDVIEDKVVLLLLTSFDVVVVVGREMCIQQTTHVVFGDCFDEGSLQHAKLGCTLPASYCTGPSTRTTREKYREIVCSFVCLKREQS